MKHPRRSHQSGYSIMELLVVIAIIGLVSLVSVPQFIAFQRANQLKTSMRQLMADLRLARQQAVSQRTQTRVRFQANAGTYDVEMRNADGTWSGLGRNSNGPSTRRLETGCTLATPVDLQTVTVDGNTYHAVIFLPDGTISLAPGKSEGTFVIRTSHALSRTSYVIEVKTPGFVKARE